MRTCLASLLVSTLLVQGVVTPVQAANPCGVVPDTLILFDRSGSMKELVGADSKWKIAVSAINNLTSTFAGQLNFGLMLFSRWPHVSNCASAKINVAVAPATSSAIATLLGSVYPDGDTPISLSLDEARTYLQGARTSKPQYVILITDGKETCQPASVNSPPAAAGRLTGDGVKTYVVGFGGAVDPASLAATAQAGDTGTYFQADDPTALNAALKKIAAAISCCGDGKVDPGETCDTAIAAGKPGACPTSCNDGNPCTSNLLVGGACSVGCSFPIVTTPKTGDGCCPPGASSATDGDCAASCGNGVLDVGEKCDTGIPSGQWGGCPQSCDDGNPCTADAVVGTGCDTDCSYSNICSANSCGDGKVDPGEWCDTAIAAGQPGACPTACDDNDSCTKDLLMGTGCLTRCANVPMTSAVGGDGCCPPGAHSGIDSDCSGKCGDGVLDGGEVCDPGILWGAGACKTAADCDDADLCTTDFVNGSACNVTCGHSTMAPDASKKDGCCPAGLSVSQDADCLTPCDPDKPQSSCFNACAGVVCKDGEYCQSGKCVPWPKSSPETPETPQTPQGPGTGVTTTGGCDCRVASLGSGLATPLLLGLAVALLVLRRRRRR